MLTPQTLKNKWNNLHKPFEIPAVIADISVPLTAQEEPDGDICPHVSQKSSEMKERVQQV